MRIGFIGAGRVGFTMGRYLKDHDVEISGYWSRNGKHAEEAAHFTDTMYYSDADRLIKDSDAIIMTVSDSAIEDVFSKLASQYDLTGKILCHTSGAMSSAVFTGSRFGVYGYSIHPNFAVSDKLTSYRDFQNAFITIEGSEEYLEDIVSLFKNTGLRVGMIKAEDKPKYHAASVFASNFVCGILGTSERLLSECGFSDEDARAALRGLFLSNAEGAAEKGVTGQLTGPLERGDLDTIRKHISVLGQGDRDLYKKLSAETLRIARRKNPDRDYSDIEELITEVEL